MWTTGCSGLSNSALITNLKNANIISKPSVEHAMLQTDRALYAPPLDESEHFSSRYKYGPYADAPQSIGFKVTISAPYIHATVLEALVDILQVQGSKVLDVGCGSGILLGYMARIVPPSSTIVGIDVIAELVEMSKKNLESDGFSFVYVDNCSHYMSLHNGCEIIIKQGDGWQGVADLGPFDAINVGASAQSVPEELIRQLKPGGVLVIPIGEFQSTQMLTIYRNVNCSSSSSSSSFGSGSGTSSSSGGGANGLESTVIRPVRFVPLVKTNPELGDAAPLPPPPVDWDRRYRRGWAYGNKPNTFLVEAFTIHLGDSLGRLRGGRVLSLGEGQGRNVVYLATAFDMHCTALDSSPVAMDKTNQLAEQRRVSHLISTLTADLNVYNPEYEAFDVIISIFCMLSAPQRRAVHIKCEAALRTGGVVIILCFSPGQERIRSERASRQGGSGAEKCSGADCVDDWRPREGKLSSDKWDLGPSLECLVGWQELASDFSGCDVLLGREVETVLQEGKFHRGPALLTQFIARKRAADRIGAHDEMEGVGCHLHPNLGSYADTIDEVFHEAESGRVHVGSVGVGVAAGLPRTECDDVYLTHAKMLVQLSCVQAERGCWCRLCWVPRSHCLCESLRHRFLSVIDSEKFDENIVAIQNDLKSTLVETLHIRWVVVVHPIEFLRSTSSVRLMAHFYSLKETCHSSIWKSQKQNIDSSCELLVYGCEQHLLRLENLLEDAVCNPSSYVILFPGEDSTAVSGQGVSVAPVDNIIADGGDSFGSGSVLTVTQAIARCREGSSQGASRLTVIVPDSSWASARALVRDIQKRCRKFLNRVSPDTEERVPSPEHISSVLSPQHIKNPIALVELNSNLVTEIRSPLIEALKEGKGLGRISTLEACALFLREAGEKATCSGLMQMLDPLVDYVRTSITSSTLSQNVPMCGEDSSDKMEQWVRALLNHVNTEGFQVAVPIGLRRCPLCGENLATPTRMRTHIQGRRHCSRVIRMYFQDSDTSSTGDVDVTVLDRVFRKYSCDVLQRCEPEPPDVALATLKEASALVADDTYSQSPVLRSSASAMLSKGERGLLKAPPPVVAAELPVFFRQRMYITYDSTIFGLYDAAVSLLANSPLISSIGHFEDAEKPKLEEFHATVDIFHCFKSRQVVYRAVSENTQFLTVYENFVRSVCCTHLKALLEEQVGASRAHSPAGEVRIAHDRVVERESADAREGASTGVGAGVFVDDDDVGVGSVCEGLVLYYQYPPTLRVQPGVDADARSESGRPGGGGGGRPHRDLEYGHQTGEVNFWLPLTDFRLTQTTLFVESAAGLGDYSPLLLNYGTAAMFHGALLHHYAPANSSTHTRVSLDFRVGVDRFFDPGWTLKEAKGKHGWRRIEM